MWIFLLGSVFAAVQQWNNSKLDISQKRILFTDTWLPGGNCIMDINSGGNIIACTGIQDTLWNVYITWWALSWYLTWYTETDPIWNATSWDYVLMSVTWDWNTAYSRVNTESGNALFFRNNSGDYVLMSMTGNWNTAYGRWDHSWLYVTLANSWDYYTLNPLGYITGYTETDPIYMANSWLYYLATNPSGYIDDSALNWEYVWTLLTPTHTWAIKVAIWDGASANWSESFAVWFNSDAIWNNSVAIWNQVSAQWYSSIAMGITSDAVGNYTFVGWYNIRANGEYSNAFWLWTQTNWVASTSIWRYNLWLTGSIFEIWIWLSWWARYNALTITNTWVIKLDQLTWYACLATDVNGAIYDNSSSFVWWVDIDTGFNNTGSDIIIPSEKTVWGLVDWLTDTYIPYRSGDKFYNSNIRRDWINLSMWNRDFSVGAIDWISIWTWTQITKSYGIAIWINSKVYWEWGVAIQNWYAAWTWSFSVVWWWAYWENSISFSTNSISNAPYSFSMIWGNVTWNADYWVAIWNNVVTNSAYWFNIWKYNVWLTNSIFELWYGTWILARKNAINVFNDGNVAIWTDSPLTYKLNVKSDIWTTYWIYSEALKYPWYFVQTGWWVQIGVISQAATPFYSQINNVDEWNSYNLYNVSSTTWWWSIIHNVSSLWLAPYGIRKWWAYVAAASADPTYKWWFYISSWSNVQTTPSGSRRIVMSWENLSIQVLSWATWIEKNSFTP